jgi:hypothetical protein
MICVYQEWIFLTQETSGNEGTGFGIGASHVLAETYVYHKTENRCLHYPSSERGSAENDGLFVIYYANSGCYEKPIRSALLVRRQNQIGIEFANKS